MNPDAFSPDSPWKKRRLTRRLVLGGVPIGGGSPVSVQTMTKTDTRDVGATVRQIRRVAASGCDLVRLAVPDAAAAEALKQIRRKVSIPLIADIHFDYRLALAALEAGVDGLRLNPGNIGDVVGVQAVAKAARSRRVPIRIGVNAGSLQPEIEAQHGGATAEALVQSALAHVRLLEITGFDAIKLSVKASDVPRTVAAYRLLAECTDFPLHLGVTEAGTLLSGSVYSTAALSVLLSEGIGDTIRVSLSTIPEREVEVGRMLLESMALRASGPRVIACPTCGRTEVDVRRVAVELERALRRWAARHPGTVQRWPRIAVMGCVVNGPGEARESELALVGGKAFYLIYADGKRVGRVAPEAAVDAMVRRVTDWVR